MTVRTFDFETGPSGSAVANADLPSNSIVLASAGAVNYSNVWARTGTMSALFNVASGSGGYILTQVPGDKASIRLYARFNALPSATTQLISIRSTGSGNITSLLLTNTGSIMVQDATGLNVVANSGGVVIPTDGSVVRFGLAVIKGTTATDGTIRAYLANGDGNPIWTYDASNVNAGTVNIEDVRFGKIINPGTINAYIDSVTVSSDTGALLGPIVASPTATVTGASVYTVDARASTPGAGGTLSYSIQQTSGPATTPTLLVAGEWSVIRHATSVLNYTVTVTESGSGQQSTASIAVPPESATSITEVTDDLVWTGSSWG